jgi:hypothetical protein
MTLAFLRSLSRILSEAFFVRSRHSVPFPNPRRLSRWCQQSLFKLPLFPEFKVWIKLAMTLIEKSFVIKQFSFVFFECHPGQ